MKIDPNNSDAKNELSTVSAAVKQFQQKEKKVFGNIFSKGGLYDDVKTETKPEVKKVDSESEEEEVKPSEGGMEAEEGENKDE